jgi:hypothetical protein
MAALPPRSVDVAISDPPYSDHVHANGRRGAAAEARQRVGAGETIAAVRPLGFAPLTDDLRRAAAVQFARLVRRGPCADEPKRWAELILIQRTIASAGGLRAPCVASPLVVG